MLIIRKARAAIVKLETHSGKTLVLSHAPKIFVLQTAFSRLGSTPKSDASFRLALLEPGHGLM
jgi:hypothetical protein